MLLQGEERVSGAAQKAAWQDKHLSEPQKNWNQQSRRNALAKRQARNERGRRKEHAQHVLPPERWTCGSLTAPPPALPSTSRSAGLAALGAYVRRVWLAVRQGCSRGPPQTMNVRHLPLSA